MSADQTVTETKIARLDGTPATFGEIAGGRTALVVNVASKCGLTPQYTGLERLHEQYADRGFTVIGVPCNQFGGQEPGSSDEIGVTQIQVSRLLAKILAGLRRDLTGLRRAG